MSVPSRSGQCSKIAGGYLVSKRHLITGSKIVVLAGIDTERNTHRAETCEEDSTSEMTSPLWASPELSMILFFATCLSHIPRASARLAMLCRQNWFSSASAWCSGAEPAAPAAGHAAARECSCYGGPADFLGPASQSSFCNHSVCDCCPFLWCGSHTCVFTCIPILHALISNP